MKRKKAVKKVEPTKKTDDGGAADAAEGKVFDVSHPGKSLPSSSSRPIIVSHKPSASDPMVSPRGGSEEEKDESNTLSAGESTEMIMATPKKNRIEPLHTDVTPETHEEASETPPAENQPDDGSDDEASDTDSAEADQPSTAEQEDAPQADADEPSDEISDIAAEVTTKKTARNEAVKKEAERAKKQAEVDALINNKQFFVPINAVQKRRSMKLMIFLIVIILLLIGLLVAWDAEVFNLGMNPPTDFF